MPTRSAQPETIPALPLWGASSAPSKIDELIQLWNMLKGEMSLVGTRPLFELDASFYTYEESRMLSFPRAITDPALIVFSDEGDILRGSPNRTYATISTNRSEQAE